MSALPPSLAANPRLSQWLSFEVEGTVLLRSGKVELGQGIGTALMQIAASELGVNLGQVRLLAGDTSCTPDEGWTSASISIEVGGAAVRAACREVHTIFATEAARRLGANHNALVLQDGLFTLPGAEGGVSYWDLASQVDLDRPAIGDAGPQLGVVPGILGAPAPRHDLPAKLARGGAFIQDVALPGMLHGRILRPPREGARLVSLEREAVARMPGVVAVVVDGSFVGACAEREEQAVAAAAKLAAGASWDGGAPFPPGPDPRVTLSAYPKETLPVAARSNPAASAVTWHEATYTRPYIAHASIGPCCAVAEWHADGLRVQSHSQGVFPLRAQLARVFDLPLTAVVVIHRDGAGCYGHNGADDVALDAALLARAVRRPVRVAWSRDEEMTAAPFGPAMVCKLSAGLDSDGRLVKLRHEVTSPTHLARPGWGDGVQLLAARHLAAPFVPPPLSDPGQVPHGGAATRNAIPFYDIPGLEVLHHFLLAAPLRGSALRALGAHANVFAIESFMDELAELAWHDPLEFRLAHLSDPRGRAVLERCAELCGWPGEAREGGALGLGFARYKNSGAYCAVAVEAEVDRSLRVTRAWAVADAGLIVNRDGAMNQVEGGVVQATSWTLKEAVTWDDGALLTRGWDSYPILRFDEVPDVLVELLDRPDLPSAGLGECATGPTAAAIGNALARALGLRVRDLPLTPGRITAAMG